MHDPHPRLRDSSPARNAVAFVPWSLWRRPEQGVG